MVQISFSRLYFGCSLLISYIFIYIRSSKSKMVFFAGKISRKK